MTRKRWLKTYRVTNLGDTVTDLSLTADTVGTGDVYLHPSMSHGYLRGGQTFTFEAFPAADTNFQNLTGVIQAQAAAVTSTAPITIDLPAGHSMFLGEAQDVMMEASAANWYCTNRPVINSQIVLPAGFRRADVVRADLLMNFTPRSGWQQRPP